ncbi:MAG: sigma-70 family RNA polymerase sigma factor, partial [Pseudomonadota bacterium]
MSKDPIAHKMIGGESAIATSLVKSIGEGDRGAENLFVQRYRDGLLFFLARQCGDASLAEDLAHDTLETVLAKLRKEGIEKPERLSSYILSTAKFLLVGHFRKSTRRNTEADLERIGQQTSSEPSQEDVLNKERVAELVKDVLNDLPNSRDRELLIRFYLDDEDKETICTSMELSSLHFNRVIHRARNRMKTALKKYQK